MKKIRIKLKSFSKKVLSNTVNHINSIASSTAKIKGPIHLPHKIRRICINRAPNIYKSSMEHFEVIQYRRLIDIINPNRDTTNSLMSIIIPSGVEVGVKLIKG